MPGHAAFTLAPDQLDFSQKSHDGEAFPALVNEHKFTTLDDIQKWAGRFVVGPLCTACDKHECKYFCAFHSILLCEECKHQDCWNELIALWKIDADAVGLCEETAEYETHLPTMTVLGLLGPAHANKKHLQAFETMWPIPSVGAFAKKKRDMPSAMKCDGNLAPCMAAAVSMYIMLPIIV